MKTILVPIDFQSTSERVLHYIEDVFDKHPVELQLISVVPDNVKKTDEEIRSEFAAFENKILKEFKLNYHFNIARGNLLEGIQNAMITINFIYDVNLDHGYESLPWKMKSDENFWFILMVKGASLLLDPAVFTNTNKSGN